MCPDLPHSVFKNHSCTSQELVVDVVEVCSLSSDPSTPVSRSIRGCISKSVGSHQGSHLFDHSKVQPIITRHSTVVCNAYFIFTEPIMLVKVVHHFRARHGRLWELVSLICAGRIVAVSPAPSEDHGACGHCICVTGNMQPTF